MTHDRYDMYSLKELMHLRGATETIAKTLSSKNIDEEAVFKWIPIDESLPDENIIDVLVTVTRWSSITDNWIEDCVELTTFHGGEFGINLQYTSDHRPIIKAWAPLPKPYKK